MRFSITKLVNFLTNDTKLLRSKQDQINEKENFYVVKMHRHFNAILSFFSKLHQVTLQVVPGNDFRGHKKG